MLSLVMPAVVVCPAWHLRDDEFDHPIGSHCRDCGRDVALPRAMKASVAVCLYCGIDAGLIDPVEVEP